MKIFAGFVFFCLFLSCMLEKLPVSISNHTNHYRSRKLRVVDWCALNCPTGENIGCTHKGECTPDAPCILESLDEQKILDAHNKLRNEFATGQDRRAAGINVANMMALVWDYDLAFLASCNLKLCTGGLEHDKCRITSTFSTAGQNLAMAGSSESSIDCRQKAYEEFTKNWYDEIEQTSEGNIKAMSQSYSHSSALGHFTQVVWAETTHIGCAVTRKPGDMTTCVMACNYGPAGNMMGGRMFSEGQPCSACPDGVSCNSKYSGLCGKGETISVTIPVIFLSLLVEKYL